MVGFSYLKNPLVALARDMIVGGEIGEVVSFRGIHAEDYMTDPDSPWTWRLDPAGGHGVVADLGSHITSIARYLAGPIESLAGQIATTVKERPVAPGAKETRPVEVDDQARALLRFQSGATGSLEASWVAAGRKLTLAFEVTGSKGTIFVDFERQKRVASSTPPGRRKGGRASRPSSPGPTTLLRRILSGARPSSRLQRPQDPGSARPLLDALPGGPKAMPDFREAWEVQRVVDGIVRSARDAPLARHRRSLKPQQKSKSQPSSACRTWSW